MDELLALCVCVCVRFHLSHTRHLSQLYRSVLFNRNILCLYLLSTWNIGSKAESLHLLLFNFIHIIYSSTSLFMVSLSVISVTHGQPWSENIKWKIPEIHNSQVLNCMALWAVWWNLLLPRSVLPGIWIIPLSSVSTLYMLLTCLSLSRSLGYQTDCLSISVLVFK